MSGTALDVPREALGGVVEFFPFDISSGPLFLGFYAGLFVVVFFVTRAAMKREGERVDARLADEADAAPANSPYRGEAPAALRVGTLPRDEDVWAVAYLRGRVWRVAEVVLVTAIARGWIVGGPSRFRGAGPQPPSGDPQLDHIAAAFAEKRGDLAASEVRLLCRECAAALTIDIGRRLVDARLQRQSDEVKRIKRFVWPGFLLLLGVGSLRTIRGIELDRPVAFLILEMLVALLAVWALRLIGGQAPRGDRYVAWLQDATTSLRNDLKRGRQGAPEELALVAALTGAGQLESLPQFATFASVLSPVASSSSSSQTTYVSSGGGGGGGGGGGCGG